MTKFLFDGIEVSITIYPIIVIVIVLGIVSAIVAGVEQYKIVGNRIMKVNKIFGVHYEVVFYFIAIIFSAAFLCVLVHTSLEASYEYLVDRGENISSAAWGSIFTIFMYSIMAFAIFAYIGMITGVVRKLILKERLRATVKLHH